MSEACATNIEDLGFQRGHRTLRILGKGDKPATIPLAPRTARTIDLAIGERHRGPDSSSAGTTVASTAAPPTAGSGRSASEPVSEPFTPTCFVLGSSWPPLDAGVPLRDVQIAARHADPRTTTIYDRRRENFDRHAAYVVVAFVAGG